MDRRPFAIIRLTVAAYRFIRLKNDWPRRCVKLVIRLNRDSEANPSSQHGAFPHRCFFAGFPAAETSLADVPGAEPGAFPRLQKSSRSARGSLTV